MRRLICWLGVCFLAAGLLVGCEDDNGTKDASIPYDKISTVTAASQPSMPQPGDLREYDTDNGWKVIATTSTQVQKQRPSCSGFDNSDVNGVGPGMTIAWTYYDDQADYNNKIVRPSLIQIYNPDCLAATDEPTTIIVDCDPCND